ncbi:unnamed protein product, partial [Cylicostephanus goldi]
MSNDLRQEAMTLFAEAVAADPQYQSKLKQAFTNGDTSTENNDLCGNEGSSQVSMDHNMGCDNRDVTSKESASAENDSQLECTAEDRQRINVGWFVGPADVPDEYDHKIAVYSQRLGCQMYNFISYPVGGVKRGFWKPG